jgi:tetratricopeptide (TPR) repeat protein
LKGNYLLKNDLAVLDIIAHNNWKRPIYFAITVGGDGFMNLEDYFQLEGLAYRLVPVVSKKKDGMPGRVAANRMYENVMNKFLWGDLKNPKLNVDPESMRMTTGLRLNLNRLAERLIDLGEKEKAIKVLDKCLEEMPDQTVPFNFIMIGVAENYYKLGQLEKANAIIRRLSEINEQDLKYYLSLNNKYFVNVESEAQQSISILARTVSLAEEQKQEALVKELTNRFNAVEGLYRNKVGYGEQ